MKIRNGFVSNSSSSSFVIIGVMSDKVLNEKMDYLCLDDNPDQCVTGIMIASGDEEYFSGEMSFVKLKEMAIKIQETLNVSEDEIKIYSGIQMC